MAILYRKGDGVEGEALVAFFRKMKGLSVIVGSGKDRQQEVILIGTPVRCFINKEVRSMERGKG
jgi:hypothetical protein